MNFTIYDTPVIIHIIQGIAKLLLKILGWKLKGKKPSIPKYVVIAAPHTSNWDLFYSFLMVFSNRHKLYFMGKHSIFKKPFGPLMKWLGGIPIDRTMSHNVVASAVEQFRKNENLLIAVPPEGTRSKAEYWKTGFYNIAYNAHVPILLGYIDYNRKELGYGPLFFPTGDIEKDMKTINEFYEDIRGRYPEMETPIQVNIKKSKKKIS